MRLLPEAGRLDERSHPVVAAVPLTSELLTAARTAAAVCPALALRLRKEGQTP